MHVYDAAAVITEKELSLNNCQRVKLNFMTQEIIFLETRHLVNTVHSVTNPISSLLSADA